ncbi:unnamed protein product, partial [Allacma fusca]
MAGISSSSTRRIGVPSSITNTTQQSHLSPKNSSVSHSTLSGKSMGHNLQTKLKNSIRESLPPKDIRVGEIHNAVLHSKSNVNSTNGSNSQSGSVSYASTATVPSGHSRPPTPSFLQPEGGIVYGSIPTTRGTRDVSNQFNNNYSSISSSTPNGAIAMSSANDTFRLLKCFYRDVQFQGET